MAVPSPIVQIILPSLLRRTIKAYALKAEIRKLGAELHRIGRSRNWQIKANTIQLEQIISFIQHSDEASWQWLAIKLQEHVKYTTYESILTIAKNNPNITINELIVKTGCTLAQARKAIDEIEFLADET